MNHIYVNPQTKELKKLSRSSLINYFKDIHKIKVSMDWINSVDTKPYDIYPLAYVKPNMLKFQDIGAPIYDIQTDKVIESSEVVDLPLDTCKKILKDDLANFRYSIEVGGITLDNGTVIHTDRETRPNLTAEYILAKENPNHTVVWKSMTGFIILDANTIITIASVAREHVADCFRREGVVSGLIDECTSIEQLREFSIQDVWDAAAP